jgi:hypothetical protein
LASERWPADTAAWLNHQELYEHFRRHGAALGVATALEYDASGRDTIRAGRRFTYREADTGRRRVGYFEAATLRFTALSPNEQRILTHYRADAPEYPRRLRSSTYERPAGEGKLHRGRR